jgi:hypothetical protein
LAAPQALAEPDEAADWPLAAGEPVAAAPDAVPVPVAAGPEVPASDGVATPGPTPVPSDAEAAPEVAFVRAVTGSPFPGS